VQGTDTSYGSQTPEHTLHVAAGRDIQDPIGVSIPVAGLKPDTIYHFQLCTAPPRDGCVQRDQTFTTGPAGGASGIAFILRLSHLADGSRRVR
jgi:hypothetical protein